jgi:NDP-sugar pyrophosphorylase family protein
MLIANEKPLRLIGFPESTMTQEIYDFMSREFQGDIQIILPDEFIALPNKQDYQYHVSFTLDTVKRLEVIDIVDSLDLDCIRYLHDTVVCHAKDITKVIGKGTIVCTYSTILLGATIGNHCIIESYCLVAHYVNMADNVTLHAGSMIGGRTTIGANCIFNFKSSAINAITVCADVEVGAASNLTKDVTVPGRYVGSVARHVGERILFQG